MNSNQYLKWLPWLVSLVLLFVLLAKGNTSKEGPTFETEHQSLVEKIESLGKLEVVKYSFRDVMEHKRNKSVWGVGISSKTLLIIGAEATACVDFTKINPKDIDTTSQIIKLTLPHPEICYIKVDHSKSKVYNTEMSIFDDAEDKLVDEAYREAEEFIKKEVDKTDIIKQAQENTRKILTPLLNSISSKKIEISFRQ